MHITCHAVLSEVGEELHISLSRAGCGHQACCHSVNCTVVVLSILWPKLAKEVLVTVVLIRYCSNSSGGGDFVHTAQFLHHCWRVLLQVSFLSQQTRVCHDKHIFVATKLLS